MKPRAEQEMLFQMLKLYCKKKHRHQGGEGLCTDCAKLAAYAQARSEHCPFRESEMFCSECPVHCYSLEMREQIHAVMRFAGPRMIWVHPVAAVRHMAARHKRNRKAGVKP